MKILLILEYYYPHIGGIETLFKGLVEELTSSGHTVTIITNRFRSELPAREKHGSLTIYRYNFINRYLFTLLALFPAITKARHHDLIQTTSYNAGFPAYIAAKVTGRPVIITFHEVWDTLWFRLPEMSRISAYLHYLFERMLLSLNFSRFVGVSDYTADALKNLVRRPQSVERIYNGIDYSSLKSIQHNPSEGPFQFLYFGRIGVSKGVHLFVEAIYKARLKNEHFVVTLIVPSRPARLVSELKDSLRKKGLNTIVSVESDLSKVDLHTKITHVDAVVIPSYSEGFCFAAAETCALGTPVISSHCGALPEVVSGKYIDIKSLNADHLAEAMLQAMDGDWKFKPLRRFHLYDTIAQYQQLYKEVLHKSIVPD